MAGMGRTRKARSWGSGDPGAGLFWCWGWGLRGTGREQRGEVAFPGSGGVRTARARVRLARCRYRCQAAWSNGSWGGGEALGRKKVASAAGFEVRHSASVNLDRAQACVSNRYRMSRHAPSEQAAQVIAELSCLPSTAYG